MAHRPWPWCTLDPDLPVRMQAEERLRASLIKRLCLAPEEPGKSRIDATTSELLRWLKEATVNE